MSKLILSVKKPNVVSVVFHDGMEAIAEVELPHMLVGELAAQLEDYSEKARYGEIAEEVEIEIDEEAVTFTEF